MTCAGITRSYGLLPERIEPTVAVPLRLRLRRWAARSPSKLGDGLMALFGYPVAQENDAERAARAALSILRVKGSPLDL